VSLRFASDLEYRKPLSFLYDDLITLAGCFDPLYLRLLSTNAFTDIGRAIHDLCLIGFKICQKSYCFSIDELDSFQIENDVLLVVLPRQNLYLLQIVFLHSAAQNEGHPIPVL